MSNAFDAIAAFCQKHIVGMTLFALTTGVAGAYIHDWMKSNVHEEKPKPPAREDAGPMKLHATSSQLPPAPAGLSCATLPRAECLQARLRAIDRCGIAAEARTILVSGQRCLFLNNVSGQVREPKSFRIGVDARVVSAEDPPFRVTSDDGSSCSATIASDSCTAWFNSHRRRGEHGRIWYNFHVPTGHEIVITTAL